SVPLSSLRATSPQPPVTSTPALHDALPIFHGPRPFRRGQVGGDGGDDPVLDEQVSGGAAPGAQRGQQQCGHGGTLSRPRTAAGRSEEHTSELQSREKLVCRLLLENTERIKT